MFKFVIAYHLDDSITGFEGVNLPVSEIDSPAIKTYDDRAEAEAKAEKFCKVLRVHVSNLDVSLR